MADRRFRRYEHCRGCYRIGLGVELAMTDRGGDVDRPVAGAADVRISPSLDRLIGANLVAEVVDPLGWVRELIAEFVVKPLTVEITLVARYPLVQPGCAPCCSTKTVRCWAHHISLTDGNHSRFNGLLAYHCGFHR